MAFGYQTVAATLSVKLNKANVKATAQDFQNKHGPKGQGGSGKKPYKFGNFAVSNVVGPDPNDQAKWLIDTGTRNWDNSLGDLEEKIRNNLSDTGPQVPMTFSIKQDGGAQAHAEIHEIFSGTLPILVGYDIIIHCRD